MWRERLKHLSHRHGWLGASGAGLAVICTVWFFGAVASPTPSSATRLYDLGVHKPGGAGPGVNAIPAASPAGPAGGLVAPQLFEQLTPQQAQAINAKTPISVLPNPAAQPFRLTRDNPVDRSRAVACLTMAVYYEAGDQGPDGEAAVAQVVLNRLRHPLFPKTVCGVVFDGASLPTGCQFTFGCDGSLGRKPSAAGWRQAQHIAERALDGYVQKDVGVATHYHTVWVVPYWQASVVKLAQIGAHVFYRWPGGLGAPAAFRGQYAGGEPAPAPIKGFDAGLAPVVLAKVDTQAPAPTTVQAVQAVQPAPAAPPQPVQVAMLTTDRPALLTGPSAPPAERPRGYFGRSQGGDVQHLPVPAHW
jgi:spore germination cell wall hydrolase CwlJ-like protein